MTVSSAITDALREIHELRTQREELAERLARAYMRLQCADVPRDHWHWEVSQILGPSEGASARRPIPPDNGDWG